MTSTIATGSEQTRRRFLKNSAAAAAVSAAAAAGGPALAARPLKAAFLYASPISDYGWSFAHEQGRQYAARELGDAVTTTFAENIPEGPASEPVLRALAEEGNRIIFMTAFGYQDQTLKVAAEFPHVRFEQATGSHLAGNVATYNIRFHEGRAVCGTIAGHMSKSGMAGYIAAFPRFEVIMGINAFTLAARRVNPEFTTRVIWTSSWNDLQKEVTAARYLTDQGADIIAQHADSPAALELCELRGCMGFGQSWDMSAFAPRAHLTTIVNRWGVYYADRISRMVKESWSTGHSWWGMREGAIEMSPYNDRIPDGVRRAGDAVRDGIIAGTAPVFSGPITDRDGQRRLAAGQVLTDDQLRAMDWYVDGVQG